jgi:predicted DNA-binding helix-hairpin-helix protein
MIIGADGTNDDGILRTSARLYGSYRLKRVYYSAFSPIPDSKSVLPMSRPPLMREHRLYQADWLMRFYGFSQPEILSARPDGMLDLDIDPKLSWALAHRDFFPVDVNRASKESLLRIPGLGVRSVGKIIESRRFRRLRLEDIGRLCASIAKVRPFVVAEGWSPGKSTEDVHLRARLAPQPIQLSLL